MLDPAIYQLLPDSITIEPFSANTVTQAPTFGAAVTYRAQIYGELSIVIDASGQDLKSSVRVIIPDRVHIDPRDRLTLPTGWVPNQPPILAVKPCGGVIGMATDSTEILA